MFAPVLTTLYYHAIGTFLCVFIGFVKAFLCYELWILYCFGYYLVNVPVAIFFPIEVCTQNLSSDIHIDGN